MVNTTVSDPFADGLLADAHDLRHFPHGESRLVHQWRQRTTEGLIRLDTAIDAAYSGLERDNDG